MDKSEKVNRLKALLTQIAPRNSLEALSRPIPESARVGIPQVGESVRPEVDIHGEARSGLQKLAENRRPEDITTNEIFGLEAIVLRENRPVTFVRKGTYDDLSDPWTALNTADVKQRINPLLPQIGRIELPPPSPVPYVGTGFIVGPGLLATNRHVAQQFCGGLGTKIRYREGGAAVNFAREIDTSDDDHSADLAVLSVEMIHPYWDMALLRVAGLPTGSGLRLSIKSPEELLGHNVVVVGYPARDDRNDRTLQDQIFENRYFVKRLQPGVVRDRAKVPSFENIVNGVTHDASTLGGNSGSAIIDVNSGEVIALHFAGEYLKANYAVPMFELARDGRVAPKLNFDGSLPGTQDWAAAWRSVEGGESVAPCPAPPPAGVQIPSLQSPAAPIDSAGTVSIAGNRTETATWTIPLRISIDIGEPVLAPTGTGAAPSNGAGTALRKELVREAAETPEDTRGDAPLLARPGFNIDTAVFLAEASSLAYSAANDIKKWVLARGFQNSSFFDSGNIQGFWCEGQDACLLAFRGTTNVGQWLRDLDLAFASHPWGHVHQGFYDGVLAVETALSEFDEVVAKTKARQVWITGHSLGGALAVIAAARLKIKTGLVPQILTYGQPAVGQNDFVERYNAELPQRLWRVVNQSDIVTRVPPWPLYRHVGTAKRIVRPGVLESLQSQVLAFGAARGQTALLENVVAGGAAMEAAAAARDAGVSSPLLTDTDAIPLNQHEFEQLQMALGAGSPPGAESPVVEGALPRLSDHAIGEYIRLLMDIQGQSPPEGH